jgi:hypothetical protein
MGTTCSCLSFFCSLNASNWISILGIVVNSCLAIWIVRTIQNRLTNKRILKNHFINEIKEIRNEYSNCLNNLYSSKTHPKTVSPWFKLMNIKINNLMYILNKKYKIDPKSLMPYQYDLQELVTNNEDFISQFKADKAVLFSDNSKVQFIRFQQDNNQIFNDIIIKINDSK